MERMVGIAQLVEQRTENPRVTSSNLVPGTLFISRIDAFFIYFLYIYIIYIYEY